MLTYKMNNLSWNKISDKALEIVSECPSGRTSIMLPTSRVDVSYINGNEVLSIPLWLYNKTIKGNKAIESKLTSI